jgi:predicted RND superfamily exporter protein
MEVAMRYTRRSGAIIGVIALVWLLIGGLVAWQRGYFKDADTNCATTGTIALTVITGPLNYAGINPKVTGSNTITVFLEKMEPLDDETQQYYDRLTQQLQADPKHVQHIQSSWENQRSVDNKAAYVELNLAGQQDESVEAVHNIVARTPAPQNEKTYVIGPCYSQIGEFAWERHLARRAPGQ